MRQVQINIGDILISTQAMDSCPGLQLHETHHRFVVAEPGPPQVAIQMHCQELPQEFYGEKLFESGGPWSLYQRQDAYVVPLMSPVTGDKPYRLAVFNQAFSQADFFAPAHQFIYSDEDPYPRVDPFQYPLDELLMVNHLGRNRLGVIVHSLGLVDDGLGYLFVGVSGAGKSTMAFQWEHAGVQLLSDDRIILRQNQDGFQMYGTPWHGEGCFGQPGSARLQGVYFLEHAPENRLRRLSAREAVSRLLVCCFPPYYHSPSLSFTLELLENLTQAVSCFALGFVPDPGVVEFLRASR